MDDSNDIRKEFEKGFLEAKSRRARIRELRDLTADVQEQWPEAISAIRDLTELPQGSIALALAARGASPFEGGGDSPAENAFDEWVDQFETDAALIALALDGFIRFVSDGENGFEAVPNRQFIERSSCGPIENFLSRRSKLIAKIYRE